MLKRTNNRGLAFSNKGDYHRALVDFNMAIDLKPDYANAYSNRGMAIRYNKAILTVL